MNNRGLLYFIPLAFSAILSASACAMEIADNMELHGYANAGYLQATDNQYLQADRNGTWDHYAGALLFTATLTENSKLWIQGFTSSGGPNRTHLDWAFVDYQPSDSLTLRAGQIKLPIGLLNDIRDIEYIQLSTLRPLIYHEATRIVGEAFQGASLLAEQELGWGSLAWDVFGGSSVDYQPAEYRYSNLAGGRLTYSTPIDGLKFMLSGFSQDLEAIDSGMKSNSITRMLSIEYVNNLVDFKGEWAEKASFGMTMNAGYLQAGYHFDNQLTPYIRQDYLVTDLSRQDSPAYFQRALVLGLGYKVNSNLGLRLEGHDNYGYALPVASGEAAAGTGKAEWQMLAASVNVIF